MSTINGLANGAIGSQPSQWVSDTTTATFQKDVLEVSKKHVVLVDFWAPWCGPCKQLGPTLEKVVNEAKGAVRLVKMNIDDHPSIAGQLGISSIPAVVAFVNGQPVDAFMGNVPESEVREFISRHSSADQKPDMQEAVEAAQELLKNGDFVQALNIFSAILQQEPENIPAIAGLATCFLEAGEVEQAKAILATAPENKKSDAALSAVLARIAIAEQIKTLGDPIALQKQIDEDPKNFSARFDLALIFNAQGEHAKAADMLLDLMREDRTWEDEKAKKQLLQFFEVWGATNPVTLSARRKLSSLLFA
ncbi:thioredoxin [Bartonella sp. HY038]|uniref:thioredoxin n=1 Tax=Bartonella sp. HY038 TaxID=2759660 RepID=UPI0015FCFD9F|nr:thioredoxin [Bartonella sp. HY038]